MITMIGVGFSVVGCMSSLAGLGTTMVIYFSGGVAPNLTTTILTGAGLLLVAIGQILVAISSYK